MNGPWIYGWLYDRLAYIFYLLVHYFSTILLYIFGFWKEMMPRFSLTGREYSETKIAGYEGAFLLLSLSRSEKVK
jgi:hypothetical protein